MRWGEPGHPLDREGDEVGGQAQARARRIDVRAARHVLLEEVVLHRAREALQRHPLRPADGRVEAQEDGRGGVDGHRRRHAPERDALSSTCMSSSEPMETPTRPTSPGRAGGRRRGPSGSAGRRPPRARLAALEQRAVAAVRLLGGAEAGVLAHRPQPAAVHRRVHPAGEGRLAGHADAPEAAGAQRLGPVGRLEPDAARGRELGLPLGRAGERRLVGLLAPALQVVVAVVHARLRA
jgi:hypothetical protein